VSHKRTVSFSEIENRQKAEAAAVAVSIYMSQETTLN
jgi:hypothetical protein